IGYRRILPKNPPNLVLIDTFSLYSPSFHFLHFAIFYRAMMAFCVISNSHPIKKSLPEQTHYYLYKYLKSKRMWLYVPPDTSNSLSPGAKLIKRLLVSLNRLYIELTLTSMPLSKML